MIFSSFLFLFGFLPVFLLAYIVSPRTLKNTTALVGSYLFYAWGSPVTAAVLFVSSVTDYLLACGFRTKHGRVLFVSALAGNLLLLCYFKYANFLVDQTNLLLQFFGMPALAWSTVLLPAGISFFTFHKISYLVDVYTERTPPAEGLRDYLLYIVLFPQLIAGPIIRYHYIADQLLERRHDERQIFEGIARFIVGLAKKVLLADEIGKVADNVFRLDPSTIPAGLAWLGACAYALQIYFDFSAYSDMAIGLGRMLGFRFPENFNQPYLSQSITEFWRRWHISLSSWMREYLYIPLGGSRRGPLRTYLNLWTVFLFSGLWHGASWTFVVWGAFHGVFLAADKLFWLRVAAKLPAHLNRLLTLAVVLVSWVLFRSSDLSSAAHYLQAMFSLRGEGSWPIGVYPALIIHNRGLTVFALCVMLSFTPLDSGWLKKIGEYWRKAPEWVRLSVHNAALLLLFALSLTAISANEFSPFLYFQF